MRSGFLGGAVFLVAMASVANAGTYYVDAVNGDDASSGLSWDEAWRTISHAGANTGWNETVLIAPGTYDAALGELFPISLAGRTFVGVAGPAETLVDGGGAQRIFHADSWQGTGALEGLWLRNAQVGVHVRVDCYMDWCDYVLVLRGVRLSEMSDAGAWGHIWTDWFDAELELRFERVVVEQCAQAVELSTFCDPNHPTDPPTAYGTLTCRDSLIAGNGGGLSGRTQGWSDDVLMTVERCTLTANTGTAVFAGGWTYGSVRDSILFGNGGDVSAGLSVSYSSTELGPLPGPGNVAGDPLFNDPAQGDYRPRFTSQCVDAAQPGYPPPDLAGTPRPLDGDLDTLLVPDMGAFELAPLTVRGEPRVGTTVDLELWGPTGGSTTVLATLAPLGGRRWTPYGWALLTPPARSLGTHRVHSGPPAIFELRIPADPALIGERVSLQALTGSPAAPAGFAWTNPLELTIVP